MSDDGAGVRFTIDEINVDRDGRSIATLVSDEGLSATVPVELLPEGAAVNQVILAEFRPDPATSRERAERVRSLQHRLFNRESNRR